MGLEPILGISPDRLPQSPYLFGYTPMKMVDACGVRTRIETTVLVVTDKP